MSKEWFYLRSSSYINEKHQEQSFARQKNILTRSGYILTDNNTFADITSEKTENDENSQFEKMLAVLNEGDWVIFSETSRICQSYKSGMDRLETLLLVKKVNVRFVSNGIDLMANEKLNPYTWYTISQTLLADELQRRIMSYNITNALEARRRQGIILGRPRTIDNDMRNTVISMHNDGKRGYKIAEELGISTATVSNILKEYKTSKT